MSSKYIDTQACMQVIGDIFINPSLLDLEDKYKFNEEDFPTEFHRILFGSIYNLHQLGAKQLSIENIEKYLEQRPKKYAIYKTNKGSEYLENLKEMCQLAAFNYYYNRMKKMTLLRMYNKKVGIDLSWLYDPDNIFDIKKKEIQETWFDNTPINEIANIINDKIDEIKSKYVDNSEDGVIQAGDGALNLLERLKTNPEIGYPLYGKLVNAIHRGARLKKLYLRSAATGVGKCVPNYTIIPTPTGDKKISEVRVNDYLFDRTGKPTKVLGVYPQKDKKEIYEIYLSDGRKAECCEEHLWTILYGKRKIKKTLELKEIYNECLQKGYQYTNRQYRFYLPLNDAVIYPERNFVCPPYVLGAFLGDGHLVENSNNHILLFNSADEEIVNNIEKELHVFKIKRCGNNYNWIFRKEKDDKNSGLWTKELFKDYPELINTNSHTKFIPKDYLTSSFSQRIDLLNGLLDTDGSVDKTGRRITYVSVSKQLIENVKILCRSLGILVSDYKINNAFGIQIRPTKEIRNLLFRLSRKKERILNNTTNYRANNDVGIIKIVPTGKFVEMTCFYVDNEEHLFLMNDYIVTHNTRSMIADACSIACNKIYNLETKQWEENGHKFIQYVSPKSATREKSRDLFKALDAKLKERRAKEKGICPVREELYSQCFDEIIRQVTIDNPDRGLLLLKVRDEIKMSIASYQILYESAILYGIRKQLQAEDAREQLKKELEEKEKKNIELTNKKIELENKLKTLKKHFGERKEIEANKREKDITFLNQQKESLEKILKNISQPIK